MNDGLLREDVTDPTGLGYSGGQPDAIFLDWVNAVLAKALGGKLATLPPDQYHRLVQQLWQDPSIQNAYGQFSAPYDPANPYSVAPTAAQMQALVSDTLTSTTGRSDNPDLVQSFLGTMSNLGVSLTTAQRNYNAASYTSVPAPFGQVPISGYKFGDTFPADLPHWSGSNIHEGTDYGTPAGTPIIAPFGGTVTYQTGQVGYGNLITLTMPDGSELRFGHVGAGTLQGPVQPGEEIGISGENIGDSTGAVTLVEYRDANGQYRDPASILDPIWKGTTFDALGLGSAAGTGLSAEQVAMRRFGVYDPTLATVFSPEVSLFKQYLGRDPTTAELQAITAGGKDAQQMEDIIRALPSHIPGISAGSAFDTKNAVDSLWQKIYGHPSNDGNIRDVWNQSGGNPSASFIQYYADQLGFQPGRNVDPFVYSSVYQAALPQSMAYHNQQPDVRDLKSIWQQGGSPSELKPTDSAAVAGASPTLSVVPDPKEQQPQ